MNRLTVEDTACKGQYEGNEQTVTYSHCTRLSPPGARVMNRLTVEDTACKGQYLLLTRTVPSGSEGNEQTDR